MEKYLPCLKMSSCFLAAQWLVTRLKGPRNGQIRFLRFYDSKFRYLIAGLIPWVMDSFAGFYGEKDAFDKKK